MTSRDRLLYVLVGTASLHVLIAIALASVEPPPRRPIVTPLVELEQVPIPPALPVPKPAPPPVPDEVEPDEPEPPKTTTPPPPTDHVEKQRPVRSVMPETRTTGEPAQPGDVAVPGGGDAPTLKIDNLGSGTVAVQPGKTTKTRHGTGGSGGGSGSGAGTGSGSGTEKVVVVSVASIKTKAKPKGDYYTNPNDDYPADAKREQIEGKVMVRLTVSADGKVTETKLLKSLGHGLDELAVSRAKKFEFVPAMDTDDKPVASIVVWTFTFTLPK